MSDICDMVKDIEDFHNKFKLSPVSDCPSLLPHVLKEFRVEFMQEELNEFIEACDKEDLESAFDALIDLIYVALGTCFLMNLPTKEGWKIVHHCNMQKVRAKIKEQSKRNSTYDVVKPEDWQPPDLSKLLGIKKC